MIFRHFLSDSVKSIPGTDTLDGGGRAESGRFGTTVLFPFKEFQMLFNISLVRFSSSVAVLASLALFVSRLFSRVITLGGWDIGTFSVCGLSRAVAS